MKLNDECQRRVRHYGNDLLYSRHMMTEKRHIQHGATTIFQHSVNVACMSLYFAHRLKIRVDEKSLVRGALLHDYFGYDWHEKDKSHRLHGLFHAKRALKNAQRDFFLNEREKNIIIRHMFPLNVVPPRYKESVLVCLADKFCAVAETYEESFMHAWVKQMKKRMP